MLNLITQSANFQLYIASRLQYYLTAFVTKQANFNHLNATTNL